jgi:hypothetical protein
MFTAPASIDAVPVEGVFGLVKMRNFDTQSQSSKLGDKAAIVTQTAAERAAQGMDKKLRGLKKVNLTQLFISRLAKLAEYLHCLNVK